MSDPTTETFHVWNVFKRRPIGTVTAESREEAMKLACAAHFRTPPAEIFITTTRTV